MENSQDSICRKSALLSIIAKGGAGNKLRNNGGAVEGRGMFISQQ